MIAMKAFPQFTRDFIRKRISYENLIYLISVIPPYRGLVDSEKDRKGKKGKKKKQIKNFHEFIQG